MRKSMLFLVMLAACAPGSDPEDEEGGGGKADDPLRVEHGDYTPGSTVEATFTASATKHAWTFTLDGHGRMTIFTRPTDRDTVLYLFRRGPGGGWGHYIAKNDDFEDEAFSQITKDLDEGVYRILVTAGDEDVRGKFNLKSRCEGPGCTTEPMDQVDAGDCIRQARECVFDALGEEELTRTQARARFDECLSGKTGESTGAACDLACAYEDAEPLCAATAEAIAYYSRQGAYCKELYLDCVPDCETADGNIMIYSDVPTTTEGVCNEYGGVSDCDRWARSLSFCSGSVDPGDCMARCLATEGAWTDDEAEARAYCEDSCSS